MEEQTRTWIQPRTLAELPSLAASMHPSATAVGVRGRSGPETLTYEALDRRSAAVRDKLHELANDGSFVVLAGDSSAEWVVAFFAIIRAGAVPIPLNQDMDDESLASVMGEINGAAVIGDEPFLARVEKYPCPRFALDVLEDSLSDIPEVSDATPEPGQLAVMLYTTGTMGNPKGVMLSHENILSNIDAVVERANFVDGDLVFTPLPLFHAFPLTVGLLTPLVRGVRAELEPKLTRMAARIRECRPTILLGVPALYEAVFRQVRIRAGTGFRGRYLMAAKAFNGSLIRILGLNAGKLLFRPVQHALGGRLRFAFSGGAPLSPELQREAFALGVPLMQGYGMTEAAPVVAAQKFVPRRFWFGKSYWRSVGSVGPPLTNVRLAFEEGEVVVSGPNVMLGYFERDQDSEDALRGGTLHTGDIGVLAEDGSLRITGRSKMAVKTARGEMVHLDRIADALAAASEVEQAFAFISDQSSGRLAAVVFPAESADEAGGATLDELRDRVLSACLKASAGLATYERIKEVRLTDEPLPTTPLGKVRTAQVDLDPSFDRTRWQESLEELAVEA